MTQHLLIEARQPPLKAKPPLRFSKSSSGLEPGGMMMRLPCTTRRGSLSAALRSSALLHGWHTWPCRLTQRLTGADRGQQSEHSQLLAGPGARKGCLAASRILLFSQARSARGQRRSMRKKPTSTRQRLRPVLTVTVCRHGRKWIQ